MVLASQFVLRNDGEKSLYFYVYELLRAFARFGDRATDAAENEFMVVVRDPSIRPVVPRRRSGLFAEARLLEIVMTSEEKVAGTLAQGAFYCCI